MSCHDNLFYHFIRFTTLHVVIPKKPKFLQVSSCYYCIFHIPSFSFARLLLPNKIYGSKRRVQTLLVNATRNISYFSSLYFIKLNCVHYRKTFFCVYTSCSILHNSDRSPFLHHIFTRLIYLFGLSAFIVLMDCDARACIVSWWWWRGEQCTSCLSVQIHDIYLASAAWHTCMLPFLHIYFY